MLNQEIAVAKLSFHHVQSKQPQSEIPEGHELPCILDAVFSKCLLSFSFQLENSNPKTQMIPQWQDT